MNLQSHVQKFIFLSQVTYLQMIILTFIQESMVTKITNIKNDKMNFSYFNNQGAIVQNFQISDSIFTIINCQLDANSDYKLQQISDIHNKSFQSQSVGSKKEPFIS